MSIQKQCVLRHRAEGHVRFQLPTELCQKVVAENVATKIKAIDGVYRVNFYARQGKVSIRFQETVCDFTQLVQQLFALFAELEKSGALIIPTEKKPTAIRKFTAKVSEKADKFAVTRWFKTKTIEAKETLHAAKIITKLAIKKPNALIKDPEKAVIDFLNDILVLFLIRLHWDHITKLWLLNPFKFRYEWLATFYMFFLLIRSRKPK
ncbi:MAG: hypothetical protein WCJ11_00720 [Methylococcaceae bacterium]